MSIRFCTQLMNTLRMLSKLDDEFQIVRDIHGHDAVLYAQHGMIYVPKCEWIYAITIPDNWTRCYADTPVTFQYKDRLIAAFLSEDAIIRITSTVIPCTQPYVKFVYLNATHVLKRANQSFTILDSRTLNMLRIDVIDTNITSINFVHYHGILDAVDLVQQSAQYEGIEESGSRFYVDALPQIFQSSDGLLRDIKLVGRRWYGYVWGSLSIVTTIVFIVLLIWVAHCFNWICCGIAFRVCCPHLHRRRVQSQLARLPQTVPLDARTRALLIDE